jgi:hypothetical protein
VAEPDSRLSAVADFISFPIVQECVGRFGSRKCGVYRIPQGRVSEWLQQTFRRTLFEQPCAKCLVSLSGDEDDRNFMPANLQFLLKVRSRHVRNGYIENQAAGLFDAIGREELFRRRECPDCKAELPKQIRKRLAHRFVVIDY